MKLKHKSTSSGFTLIEILVFMGILVILGAGFLGLQYVFSQNQVTAWQNYLNVEDANNIMATMAKEIRDARQSELGTYLLDTAEDNQIIFFADIDYDDVTERVRYTLTGNTLVKGVIEPEGTPVTYPDASETATTLSTNIRNDTSPMFTYYNSDWPSDTVNNPLIPDDRISQTRIVRIIIVSNTNEETDTDYTLESSVRIRMLDDE